MLRALEVRTANLRRAAHKQRRLPRAARFGRFV